MRIVLAAAPAASTRPRILLLAPGDRVTDRALGERLATLGFRAERGTCIGLDAGGSTWIVAGLGDGSPGALHAAALRGVREASRRHVRAVDLRTSRPIDAAEVRSVVEGLRAGAYRFDLRGGERSRTNGALDEVRIVARVPRGKASIEAAETTARAVALARDLVNAPASHLGPEAFARRARLAARRAGLAVRVLDRRAIEKLGAGGVLGVAQGSASSPRIVHLHYRPAGRPTGRVALLGKGVTFDSGGLNLKPGSGMASMKADMAGAAAVLAAMTSLRAVGCRHEVHGLLGLVENMTGAGAFRPGDVLETLSGKTVEVTNTDAEGRLVLCDLLAYAGARLRPDRIVDLATLTGAVVVALGTLASGLFANDDALAGELSAAAGAAGEKLWRMPLYDEYLDELLEGPADLKNCGERWGGAISAALFLREFVPAGVPWAHLDIAGPAFLETAKGAWPAGATGAGVPTLLRWLAGR